MNKRVLYILIAIFAVSLVSCQTTQRPYQPRIAPSGFTIDKEGALVHVRSGGMFPLYLNSFVRGYPYNYDEYAYDISVGYSLYKPGDAEATIYITLADKDTDAREYFDSIEHAIAYYHPHARQVEEYDTMVELDDGTVLSGYCAVYSYQEKFHGRKQRVESQAFLFKKGDWFISFRITYPLADNYQSIKREVNAIVTNFDYSLIL